MVPQLSLIIPRAVSENFYPVNFAQSGRDSSPSRRRFWRQTDRRKLSSRGHRSCSCQVPQARSCSVDAATKHEFDWLETLFPDTVQGEQQNMSLNGWRPSFLIQYKVSNKTSV